MKLNESWVMQWDNDIYVNPPPNDFRNGKSTFWSGPVRAQILSLERYYKITSIENPDILQMCPN